MRRRAGEGRGGQGGGEEGGGHLQARHLLQDPQASTSSTRVNKGLKNKEGLENKEVKGNKEGLENQDVLGNGHLPQDSSRNKAFHFLEILLPC